MAKSSNGDNKSAPALALLIVTCVIVGAIFFGCEPPK